MYQKLLKTTFILACLTAAQLSANMELDNNELSCFPSFRFNNSYCPKGVNLCSLEVTHHSVTTNRTFPTDSTTIELNVVQASSNTGGRDILMVHGFPHAWPLYKNQLGSFLSESNNLYAMDLRGFGESENPGLGATVWNTDTLARDFAAVIDDLNLDHPIIIVHSFSGPFLADFLRVFGDSGTGGIGGEGSTTVSGGPAIGGIILLCTYPEASPAYLTAQTEQVVPSALTTHFEELLPALKAFANLSTFHKLHRSDYAELLEYDMSNSLQARIGSLTIPLPTDHNFPVWSSVTVPVMIISGSHDSVIQPNGPATFAELFPNAVHKEINKSGHLPHYEKPSKLNNLIAEFIDSL